MKEIEKYKLELLKIEGVYSVGEGEGNKLIVYVNEKIEVRLPEPPEGIQIEIIKGKKIKPMEEI
ncbi:MAG: hypothetical protein DRP12_03410 [Candidatus Aenigmatarchaeota archaeon]|nr:MAG: hypothetical protein DRP12_03410 [Candidatus Aenigmarchaeota archaeon]